ncbi:ABC transporter permease [Ilumatobacter nonamiensis]|uniref:ABC transporter permease n=1 Tax=Ilumatobacter nonamiensis TaxID=467093 RepID=UPI0011D1E6C6|nr:ABC transporter permease [Ilumatobacter nonamiensis]
MNVGRYVATLVAIITGVAFFTAAGFLSDRVIDALEGQTRAQYEAVDAAITVDDDPDAPGADFAADLRISADVADQIAALPEVDAVGGDLTGSVAFLGDDGTAFADGATGRAWIVDDDLNPIDVDEGSPPQDAGQIAVDRGTADGEDLAIGDSVTLLALSGQHDVTIVGITSFGDNDAEDQGGTVSLFETDAFDWLNGGSAEFEDLFIRGNTDESAIVEAVEPLVPSGFVVQPGSEFVDDQVEQSSGFGKFLKVGLQVFAGIALLVGGFVILNTFTVIVAQRLRELAVLAAIGATPRQIKRSLRYEGLAIGVIGSALGVLTGLGLAFGLMALLSAFDVGLPGSGISVSPSVVVQGMIAGTLITFLSVMRPARKAAKTEPIEALRVSAVETATLTRKRIIWTAILIGFGAYNLFFGASPAGIGVGAFVFFIGVIVAGPIIALAGSRVFRPIAGRRGLEGRLAADNVGRNPQRTATTANALLIGVFLVTFVSVAGASLKDYAVNEIDELASADFFLVSAGGTIDDELVTELNGVDGVERVVTFRSETVAIDDGAGDQSDGTVSAPAALSTGDFTQIQEVANLDIKQGSLDALGSDTVIVIDQGEEATPSVGSTVTYAQNDGSTFDLEVVGVMDGSLDATLLGGLVSTETFAGIFGEGDPNEAFIDAVDGEQTDVEERIEEVTDLRPDLALQRGSELAELIGGIFDFLINAINGLLLMSVVVALIGIVNTMSLSIIERRRELGLLRVVGMLDRRVRRMVRIESILISTLGTVTGVVMGVVTGFALVYGINRLSDAGIDINFAWVTLAVILVLGVLLGYLAALIPANRSTKTELLEAIQVT